MVKENGIVMMTENEYLNLLEQADPYNFMLRKATETCKYNSLPEAIIAIRGDRSIRRMAEDTGVAASYIVGIIKGEYVPSLQILKKLVAPQSKPRNRVTLFELIMLSE